MLSDLWVAESFYVSVVLGSVQTINCAAGKFSNLAAVFDGGGFMPQVARLDGHFLVSVYSTSCWRTATRS